MAIRGVFLVALVVSFHLGVIAAIGWGLRSSARRAGRANGAVTVGVPLILLGWLALVCFLAQRGFFAAKIDRPPDMLLAGVIVPIVVGVAMLAFWKGLREALDATPQHWLVGVQVYRSGGGIFFIMYLQHDMPWQFGVLATVGDMTAAVTALLVARAILRKASWANGAAKLWAIGGATIMAVVVGLGCVTSPCTWQRLAFDFPNRMITAWPLVVTGVYIAPLSIILHLVVLRDAVKRGRHA